jgi:hypothetical protein
MTKRYRWLSAKWPIPMRTLGRRLKSRPFGPDSTHGFVVDRIRDDMLEARYVERIDYTETITDPFGQELTFERVEFRQSHFRATTYGPGLEVRDPPRTLQPLMNRLSEATDFEVAITPHSVDVLKWAAKLQLSTGLTLVVDSLQMNSLQLDEGITAKVVFKGDRDVRQACIALAANRKFLLERVQIRFERHGGTIVLSSSAGAVLNLDDPDDVLLGQLRGELP